MATWADVLDHIDRGLEQQLGHTIVPDPAAAAGPPAAPSPLDRLDHRLRQWESRLEAAETQAADVDAALAQEHAALLAYRGQLTEVTRSLLQFIEGAAAAPAPATAAGSRPSRRGT